MMPVPGRAVTVMTRGAFAMALIAAAGSTETDFTGLVASIALLLAMTRDGWVSASTGEALRETNAVDDRSNAPRTGNCMGFPFCSRHREREGTAKKRVEERLWMKVQSRAVG
jgi:hypothetical protein